MPTLADLIADGLTDYLTGAEQRPALGAPEHVAAYLTERGWTLTPTDKETAR